MTPPGHCDAFDHNLKKFSFSSSSSSSSGQKSRHLMGLMSRYSYSAALPLPDKQIAMYLLPSALS
jgi:hypothetical protein